MRVLIFGCGYLGRRVATAWIESGLEVFAVTRSPEKSDLFRKSGIQPFIGDVCEPASLDNLPDADIVLYSVGYDRTSSRTHEEVTCHGTEHILERLKDRCGRFIYTSSTSVYGQSSGEWVDERSECNPSQLGGRLNLIAEQSVQDRFPKNRSTSAVILRLAGLYGSGRLLSRKESLLAAEPISGRGDSWLNLIHVDDATRAVIASSKDDVRAGIYNVVDDQPVRRAEYFELLAELIGAPPPTFDASQPGARGSGGLNKRCSNQKLRTESSWKPAFPSFATGLPASIET